MTRFRDLSIRTKLVVLILAVSLILLAMVGGARLAWDLRQERKALVQEMSALTRLLGDRSSAALAFDDTRLAAENLASLQALPHVELACLYRKDGTLLSGYQRDNMAASRCLPTGQWQDMEVRFDANLLHVATAILQGNDTLGWIYLGSDLSLIDTRFRDQLLFSGVALVFAFLIAGLLAVWLQRLISGPIEAVTRVARAIEERSGQQLRAPVTSQDEVGRLALGFNAMLDTLEAQNTQLEAARAEQQAALVRYRSLVESTSAIPWELDPDTWRFVFVGHQAEAVLGYPVEDWYQNHFWPDHMHADDRNASFSYCQSATTALRDHQIDYRMLAADGHIVWIHDDVQVISEAGKAVRLQGFKFDVTERKRHEEAINNIAAGVSAETGEAFFRHLVEHLARIFDADYAFIGVLDKDDPLQVNTLAVCTHGHIVDNMSYSLGGSPCANIMGQSTCAFPSGVQQQFPEDRLLVDMGADGYIGTPLFDSHGKPLGILVVLDSKPLQRIEQVGELLEIFAARAGAELERIQAEEALRGSETHLRTLIESLPDLVWLKDPEGIYLACNPKFERYFGAKQSEIVGKTDYNFIDAALADFFREKDRHAMAAGKPCLNEEEVTYADDGHREMLETIKTPMYTVDGKLIGVLGVGRDITERKQTEEALRRSQKMEAIGQISGGIAHDFNNQLGVIIGYLDFLKNHFPQSEKPRQWVDTATRATLRCMDLTRQLLAFSRRQARKKTVVDLNIMIKELETMIARSVTPEVEVQYYLADELWPTEIDPGEFQDAILNLVINARDAMPDGGRLLIETSTRYLDTEYSARNPGVDVGDYVQLMLSDTGTGMNSETQEHIFEPFFTTKPEGKGTGLGLAMVYGFVNRYGGHIKVYSEYGVGTTFRLNLPRSKRSENEIMTSNDPVPALPGGSESILIVDDEADLLQLADRYLSDLGYRTYRAENTTQALEILARDIEIDLMFSDVVMPGGMNGYELAQQASELRPNIKVLLTSGFTSKVLTHSGLTRYSAHILNKPYRKDDLAQRIRLVLDEALTGMSKATDIDTGKDILANRTILVIDDEKDIRELFELNLEKLGCKTITACSGDEALVYYQQSLDGGDAIDAIILDLSIPGGMDGKEITSRIRSLDPNAKIIVASGYTEGPEMTHYQDFGFNGALEKNFNREIIKHLLEQVLTSA